MTHVVLEKVLHFVVLPIAYTIIAGAVVGQSPMAHSTHTTHDWVMYFAFVLISAGMIAIGSASTYVLGVKHSSEKINDRWRARLDDEREEWRQKYRDLEQSDADLKKLN